MEDRNWSMYVPKIDVIELQMTDKSHGPPWPLQAI